MASKKKTLVQIHTKALSDFNDVSSAQQEGREKNLRDRRFAIVTGAQWEGSIGPTIIFPRILSPAEVSDIYTGDFF